MNEQMKIDFESIKTEEVTQKRLDIEQENEEISRLIVTIETLLDNSFKDVNKLIELKIESLVEFYLQKESKNEKESVSKQDIKETFKKVRKLLLKLEKLL